MTTAGWVFMLCSLGFVVGLNIFCFGRVLFRPETNEQTHDKAKPVSRP